MDRGKNKQACPRGAGIPRSIHLFVVCLLLFISSFPAFTQAAVIDVDEVTGMEVSPPSTTLIEGMSITPKATLVYKSGKRGPAKNITWKPEDDASENNKYVSIDAATGKLTALNPDGSLSEKVSVNVIAVYDAGKDSEIKSSPIVITVQPRKVTSLSVSPTTLSLMVGESKPLAITAKYNDGKSEKITSNQLQAKDPVLLELTSNSGAIEIDDKGNIVARKDGVDTIKVSTTAGDVIAYVPIEVYTIRDIVVSPNPIEIIDGQSVTPKATLVYSNGKTATAKGVKWEFVDPTAVDKGIILDPVTGKITVNISDKENFSWSPIMIRVSYPLSETEKLPADDIQIPLIVKKKEATGLIATPTSLSALEGESKPLKITLQRNDGTKVDVSDKMDWSDTKSAIWGNTKAGIPKTWEELRTGDSTNQPVVRYDSKGQISFIGNFAQDGVNGKEGNRLSFTLTGKIKDEFQAEYGFDSNPALNKVNVPVMVEAVQKIELSKQVLPLIVGQTGSVTTNFVYTNQKRVAAKGVKWKLQDGQESGVLQIDEATGKIKVLKVPSGGSGSNIPVEVSYGDVKATLNVTVVDNSVKALQATPASLSLCEGDMAQIKVSALRADGKMYPVDFGDTKWDKNVWPTSITNGTTTVSVDASGNILARSGDAAKAGSVKVRIVLTADPSKFVDVPVMVYRAKSIDTIDGSSTIALYTGQSVTPKMMLTYTNGTTVSLPKGATWKASGSNSNSIVVSEGKITALAPGSGPNPTTPATVTVPVTVEYLGIKRDLNVIVNGNPPISLVADPTSLSLVEGESKPLKVTAEYKDGKKEALVWGSYVVASSDPTIAKAVDGKVVAVKEGNVTLTITYPGVKNASVSVNVTKAPVLESLKAEPSTFALTEGQTAALKVTAIYSNGKQAAVPANQIVLVNPPSSGDFATVANGKVIALKAGPVPQDIKIRFGYVAIPSNPSNETTITVNVGAKSSASKSVLAVNPTTLTMVVGESKQLKATVTGADGKVIAGVPVSWIVEPDANNSDNTVGVDPYTGNIVANQRGAAIVLAKVTADAARGIPDMQISVPVFVEGIVDVAVTPGDIQLIQGKTTKLPKVELVYSSGKKVAITEGLDWTEGSSGLLQIDSNAGSITASKDVAVDSPGQTFPVELRLTNAVRAKYGIGAGDIVDPISIPVTVVPIEMTGVLIKPDKISLNKGESVVLQVTAVYNDGSKRELTPADGVEWKVISDSDTGTILDETALNEKWEVKPLSSGSVVLEVEYAGFITNVGINNSGASTTSVAPKLFAAARSVSPQKTWSIRFNTELDPKTVNEANVTVTDAANHFVPVKVKLVGGDTIQVTKAGGYEPGKQYYLNVKRYVKSKNGTMLKQNVRKPFMIQQ